MFYAASGRAFKLQTPGKKLTGYPHGAKLSRAHITQGSGAPGRGWGLEAGLRAPEGRSGSAALPIPEHS